MKEILLRMVLGGTLVSAFALLGDIFKPKRFAGLFGAAPSVALATLALTAETEGKSYAAMEARSMVGGAIAFFAYSSCVFWLMFHYKLPAHLVTLLLIPLWIVTAFGIWFAFLR
jgi:uncharacterized membrane protein (GlpM family)